MMVVILKSSMKTKIFHEIINDKNSTCIFLYNLQMYEQWYGLPVGLETEEALELKPRH